MTKNQIESSYVAGHTIEKLQGVKNQAKYHIKATIYLISQAE